MRWLRFALPAIIILALGGLLWARSLPFSAPGTATATASVLSATYTITYTLPPATFTSTSTPVLPSGPIGVLHFQNGSALADQATLLTQGMPAPPPGYQYELWLTGGDELLSLGAFLPDSSGKAELTFSDPDGLNLLSRYDGLQVTIEPNPDPDPASPGALVYAFTLPESGVPYLRYLLFAFSKTPEKNSLIQGLYTGIKQIADLAKEMQTASLSGDTKTVQQKAETAINLLVGAKSPDYKDWNGDKKIDPSKSYGLLLNGSELGYIRAVQQEADYLTTNTQGATEYMIVNGKALKVCTQNMEQWAPDLRTLLLAILNAPDANNSESIDKLVALSDQMLHGIDLDKNGKVDAISGECGGEAAYGYAYHMADMPILPTGLSDQLTQVANTLAPLTGTVNPNGTAIVGTPVNSKTPRATRTPRPVNTPRPANTKKPTGGGGGGGGKPPPKKTQAPKQ